MHLTPAPPGLLDLIKKPAAEAARVVQALQLLAQAEPLELQGEVRLADDGRRGQGHSVVLTHPLDHAAAFLSRLRNSPRAWATRSSSGLWSTRSSDQR